MGEPKENKLVLKNIGMYSVKFNFTMKKKQTREIFSVDPMEGDLQPGEEKSITVKFQSQKELKLKTSKNESDIILNIIEGKSQEKHTYPNQRECERSLQQVLCDSTKEHQLRSNDLWRASDQDFRDEERRTL